MGECTVYYSPFVTTYKNKWLGTNSIIKLAPRCFHIPLRRQDPLLHRGTHLTGSRRIPTRKSWCGSILPSKASWAVMLRVCYHTLHENRWPLRHRKGLTNILFWSMHAGELHSQSTTVKFCQRSRLSYCTSIWGGDPPMTSFTSTMIFIHNTKHIDSTIYENEIYTSFGLFFHKVSSKCQITLFIANCLYPGLLFWHLMVLVPRMDSIKLW